jgi:arsenite methyltransferase
MEITMAATCPIGFNVDRLREQVRNMYERLARAPEGEFHFHRGGAYASERLEYDAAELATLPPAAVDSFAGVGNPLRIGPLRPGEVVLDHACGGGLDLLLAARRVAAGGAPGRAIGVDMTPAMRERAQAAADAAGLGGVVEIRAGLFEDLPVPDTSVDVVISNGVLNLAPDKPRVLREIARVLRPGGRLYLADVVVQRELSLAVRSDPELWAACVGGALPESELLALTEAAGLTGGRVLERFDSLGGTGAGARVAKDLHVHAVNLFAERGRT